MATEGVSGGKEGKRPGVATQTINVVAEAEDLPICWICLDGPQPDKPLIHPCRCPSFCHASCIARWQLQSAGTRREMYCDFCSCQLPDWKSILTPCGGASAPAVMNVNFDNKTYSFQVSPGADGYKQFTEAIRKAFHLPEDSELNITFTCDEPSSAGALLTLSGPGAYDAAVHCASVSAARRSTSLDHPSSGCMAPVPGIPTTNPLPPAISTHPLASHELSRSSSADSASVAGNSTTSSRRVSNSSSSGAASEYGDGPSVAGSYGGGSSSPYPEGPSSLSGMSQEAGGTDGEQEDGSSDSQSRSSSGRRGSGLGRKLRNAISDLLVIR